MKLDSMHASIIAWLGISCSRHSRRRWGLAADECHDRRQHIHLECSHRPWRRHKSPVWDAHYELLGFLGELRDCWQHDRCRDRWRIIHHRCLCSRHVPTCCSKYQQHQFHSKLRLPRWWSIILCWIESRYILVPEMTYYGRQTSLHEYTLSTRQRSLGCVTGSSVVYDRGRLTGNSVQYSLNERNKDGLGGAVFLGNSSFSLRRLAFDGNSAYFGAGIFVNANLSRGGALQELTFGTNLGLMGPLPPLDVNLKRMQALVKRLALSTSVKV